MAISVSVTDVIKLFRDKGIKEKEQVADYLDIMSHDADQLCEYWRELLLGPNLGPGLARDLRIAALRQRMVIGGIMVQRERSSSILTMIIGAEKFGELLDALSTMMLTRNKIKAAYDHNLLTLDRNDPILLDLLDALHEEAGTLKGLAQAIKASL